MRWQRSARKATRGGHRCSQGQSLAEYALVIGFVILAFSVMQVYVKRSLQGKFKGVADQAGVTMRDDSGGVITRATQQYEPYYTASDHTIGEHAESKETMSLGGTVDRTGISQTTTDAVGGRSVTRGSAALGNDDAWR